MVGKVGFEEQDTNEEALRLAISLYQREKSKEESAAAARSALNELNVPEGYLEAAKEHLAREKQTRRSKASRRVALAAIAACTFLVFALCVWMVRFGPHPSAKGLPAYEPVVFSLSPTTAPAVENGPPLHLDFSKPRTDWLLDANPESDVEAQKLRENGVGFERILVRSFHRDPSVDPDSDVYASFLANLDLQGEKRNLHGLNTLQIVVRAQGLKRATVGFEDEDGGVWYSETFDVGPRWQTIKVDLNNLHHIVGETWLPAGRVGDACMIRVQVGDGNNGVDASGHLDVQRVDIE